MLAKAGDTIGLVFLFFVLCLFSLFGLAGIPQMNLLNIILTLVIVLGGWIWFIYLIYNTISKNSL